MSVSNEKGNESESVVRKRRWRSAEEKRAIAEASLKAGTSVREVAERCAITQHLSLSPAILFQI